MEYYKKLPQQFFLSVLLFLVFSHAVCKTDEVVTALLQRAKNKTTLSERLVFISHLFLGQPYLVNPLGEGKNARYVQRPLYRFDGFDCLTYVETSLALAHAKTKVAFIENINALRYKQGKVDYLQRNHFMSLDWNKNNQRFIQDVTDKVVDDRGQPLSLVASAYIDKGAWLEYKTEKDLVLPGGIDKNVRLKQLKKAAHLIQGVEVKISYLPLTALFNQQGQPKAEIFNQIPNGSIIEIIRPNWQLKNKIGSNLHVSHLGFAFRIADNTLIFRQASSKEKRVIESPLSDYLKDYINSQTVKGIKIFFPRAL